jgi:fatty-acyl-CoA synthase
MDTVQQYLRARGGEDTTGLLAGDRSWTWREYVAAAGARANAVRTMLDDARPPHVGVLMENTPELAFALGAGGLAGYVTAGINSTRRGSGLSDDVATADCQVLLTDARHLPLLDGLDLPGVRVVDTGGEEWAKLVAAQPAEVREPREVATMDTFMLIFTSGTSGAPKAVQVSNFMVVISGSMLAERFSIGPADVCYVSMPLFHSNAVVAGYAVALCGGAAMALAPRFSASGFLSDVRRYGATYANYVGKPLAYVLQTPRKEDDADNPLRVAFGNEASDKDIAEFAERFGCVVWDGFGSTENAVVVTRVPGTPPGSIGMPLEGVAVYDRGTRTECPRATFDATGRVTNLDEAVGELVNTTGAGFFSGYYNDPEATANRLDGGMYWSGDLAYRDEAGFVYYAGRTSDWLRVDGENLAAGVVERILLRHPAVNRVAVYGVPDPRSGDQLVAALVLNDGARLGPGEFERFLDAQPDLAAVARPRHVRIAADLPSTATNKVLKRELVRQGLDFGDPRWEREERGTAYRVVEPAGSAG